MLGADNFKGKSTQRSLRFLALLVFSVPTLASLGRFAGWPPLTPSNFGAINIVFPLLLALMLLPRGINHMRVSKKSRILIVLLFSVILSGLFHIVSQEVASSALRNWLVLLLGITGVTLLPKMIALKPNLAILMTSAYLLALIVQLLIIFAELIFGFRLDTVGNQNDLWRAYASSGKSFSFLIGTLGNPNDLAIFLNFCLLMAFYALSFQKHKTPYVLVMVLTSYVIFSTESRSGILIFVFNVILLASFVIRRYIRFHNVALIALLFSAFLTLVYLLVSIFSQLRIWVSILDLFYGFKLIESDNARASWAISSFIKVSSESPFIGFGPESTRNWLISSGLSRAEVHNGIVQIGFEYGLLSMFLFTLLLGVVFFQSAYRFLSLKSQLVDCVSFASTVNLIAWLMFTSEATRQVSFWWGLATTVTLVGVTSIKAWQPKDSRVVQRIFGSVQ